METPAQTLARAQKFLNPEVSAKDLVSPAEPMKLPEPTLPTLPSTFVENLAPVTKTADDAIVRVNSDEAKLQNKLLGSLTGRDTVSTRDVYQDTFDAEIERMTGVKAPEAMRRLADENIKLAQLQGKFRTAGQKVSSADGQSKVFEGVQLGELSRQEAVEVGNQAILVQALQGNMSAARQTALDTAKFAYDDEVMELDNLISQLDAITGIVDQQRQDIVDAEKAEAEARKEELDRTRTAIDTAILSGGATVAEMQKLTDLNVPDTDKQALAQMIVARTTGEDRNLDRANTLSNINGRSTTAVTGDFSDVISSAANLVGSERGKTTREAMNSAIESGDYASAYALMANNVEESLTGDVKTKFANARTDYAVLQGMQNAIEEYTNAGGDLGFLKGTADQIARRFGQLKTDPEFASLAVQLEREFQSYRQNMTGAAFSGAESREYASVNPRSTASLDLNLATIDGALNQLENRITSTINTRIPSASKLYDAVAGNVSAPADGMTDDEAYEEYLKMQNQ